MAQIALIFKGMVIGFSIAAPVGPIGILCIRRTLSGGRLLGLASGLGAASADALYGAVAAFGMTALSNILTTQQTWLKLAGGVFLCYLGVRTFLTKPAERPAQAAGSGLFGAYCSTLFLTLTNPMTILSFAAIFAGIGAISSGFSAAALLVGSVFAGSAAWWLLLSGGVSVFRARFNDEWMGWVNRISGAIIMVFGLSQFINLIIFRS